MKKKLLLTVSGEQHASQNLQFVTSFLDRREDMELTLFFVAPRRSDWHLNGRELTPGPVEAASIEEIKNTQGHAALDRARTWAKNHGYTAEQVHSKVIFSRLGTVRDIIHEARHGLYDAVVLGRRGLSWFEEMFEDSVSHSILWEELDFPIWVCRRPNPTSRHVLLCTDGSDPALRIADHVGFFLAEEERHDVLILHVRDDPSRPAREVDDILVRTSRSVSDNGVDPKRIRTRVVDWPSIPDTILALAEKESMGVVAVGQTGSQRGRLSRIVFGSTSQQLLRKCDKCVLWISR